MNYRTYLDIEAVARQTSPNGIPFRVTLGHSPNPDLDGGYWQEPETAGAPFLQPAGSLADAARICRNFIDRNSLGGGNWGPAPIGDIFAWSSDGVLTKVGRVSYNGRVWGTDGSEIKLQAVQG